MSDVSGEVLRLHTPEYGNPNYAPLWDPDQPPPMRVARDQLTQRRVLDRSVGLVLAAWRSHLRMDVAYGYDALAELLTSVIGEGMPHDPLSALVEIGAVTLSPPEPGRGDELDLFARLRPVRLKAHWLSTGTASRPRVSKDCRDFVVTRDQGRCRYCYTYAAAGPLDHVVPHSVGGPTDRSNLVLSCASCNGSKLTALWIPEPINGIV